MGNNLIAYIPTLNQRHIDWFKQRKPGDLYLISQEMAETMLPRLSRNMSALTTEMVQRFVRETRLVRSVGIFDPEMRSLSWSPWVLPDEDVSHALAEKYLRPKGVEFEFDMIWARWDMTAVHRDQPVMADVLMSESDLDRHWMSLVLRESKRSPDWWRQIGAAAVDPEGNLLAVSYNTHMPNEYETYIFGDPRLNVDAGQKGKYCALHAERAVIALCARQGLSLQGTSLYVTTFPCEDCAREIAFAGVTKLFFRDGYSVLNAQEVLTSNGVTIVRVV